jgi:hypothetical protein
MEILLQWSGIRVVYKKAAWIILIHIELDGRACARSWVQSLAPEQTNKKKLPLCIYG